ncbi:MAG TPA: ATP synthase F1 subunit delta [Acidimicrobiaceae bacterium]|nr:ATP synthase F1 subunit delta [Acidimicrobiaceae bacterium]HCB37408.1 ATP synthase F1 subunit delta [Acidimicrobiaceae bacterium]
MTTRVEGYAAAVVAAADAEDRLDRVRDELFALGRAVAANDALRTTLADRTIPLARRLGVLEDLLADQASPVTLNLVAMLVGAGRGSDLAAIADEVLTQAAAKRGSAVAEVHAAVPLSADQVERLAAALRRASGRNVTVQVVVDADVVGGITAQVGDTVYDGSVRTRLDKMKELLA